MQADLSPLTSEQAAFIDRVRANMAAARQRRAEPQRDTALPPAEAGFTPRRRGRPAVYSHPRPLVSSKRQRIDAAIDQELALHERDANVTIATRLGVPVCAVKRRRAALGLPPSKQGPHGPIGSARRDRIVAMLANAVTNLTIAAEVGCTSEYVRQVRKSVGMAPRSEVRQEDRVAQRDAIIALVREGLSDQAIAERLSLSESTVLSRRRLFGLKSGRSVRSEELAVRVRDLHARGLSDYQIAKELGLHRNAGHRLRSGLGLPALFEPFGGSRGRKRGGRKARR